MTVATCTRIQMVCQMCRGNLGAISLWSITRPSTLIPSASCKRIDYISILFTRNWSAPWVSKMFSFCLPDGDLFAPAIDCRSTTTFSQAAEYYQRRSRYDAYNDFCQLRDDGSEPIIFLGLQGYLPLFQRLTDGMSLNVVVFLCSAYLPQHRRWRVLRFETNKRTNWHYDCARALLAGQIAI